MRHVVMIVAVLGGLATAFIGYRWFQDWKDNRQMYEAAQMLKPGSQSGLANVAGVPVAEQKRLKEFLGRPRTAPFLLAGLLMGIFGAVLAMNRHGFSAALVLLVAAAGPFVVHAGSPMAVLDLFSSNEGMGMLVFSSGLFLAAFLSLFVWAPRPREDRKATPPKKKEEEEDDRDYDDDEFDDEED